jgi:hypothetical protein
METTGLEDILKESLKQKNIQSGNDKKRGEAILAEMARKRKSGIPLTSAKYSSGDSIKAR